MFGQTCHKLGADPASSGTASRRHRWDSSDKDIQESIPTWPSGCPNKLRPADKTIRLVMGIISQRIHPLVSSYAERVSLQVPMKGTRRGESHVRLGPKWKV
jgi:hypothetical protein